MCIILSILHRSNALIESNQLDSSDLGFLLADFRQALHTASAALLHHVCRFANMVAHLLTNEARSNKRVVNFFVATPLCVEETSVIS